jgi:competence protein ComEA
VSAWLQGHRSTILSALAAAVVAGLVVLLLQHRGGRQPLEIRFDDPAVGGAAIEVYVAGAVQKPGVYAFKDGDRLVDALDAAGGPSDDANLTSVNLAKRLHDEDQVVVPRQGQVAAVAGAAAVRPKIDINTADASTLDTLPGIGAAYSQRIVDSRTTVGLYESVDDLVDRKLIPRSTLDKIRDLISVGP